MAKKKARKPSIVPPKGAPANLRPAGPHKEQRERPRAEQRRAALENQAGRDPRGDETPGDDGRKENAIPGCSAG
jgi:hypothetical protein